MQFANIVGKLRSTSFVRSLISTLLILPMAAFAQQLPSPPSDLGGSDGNWFGVIGKAIQKGGGYFVLAVVIFGGIWCAYSLIHKTNEWRNGRADAGELTGHVVGMLIILTFVVIIGVYTLKIMTDNSAFLGGTN